MKNPLPAVVDIVIYGKEFTDDFMLIALSFLLIVSIAVTGLAVFYLFSKFKKYMSIAVPSAMTVTAVVGSALIMSWAYHYDEVGKKEDFAMAQNKLYSEKTTAHSNITGWLEKNNIDVSAPCGSEKNKELLICGGKELGSLRLDDENAMITTTVKRHRTPKVEEEHKEDEIKSYKRNSLYIMVEKKSL